MRITLLFGAVLVVLSGCVSMEQRGLYYKGSTAVDDAELLVDRTWLNDAGVLSVEQEIFDGLFEMIDEAESFILLDLFLVNDFGYVAGPGFRPISSELAHKLIEKKTMQPQVEIVFITDPVNTVYHSMVSPQFSAMEAAGIRVVWTDLNKLRDSNPIYSMPWRLLGQVWGTGPGQTLKNPLGKGRVSLRSFFKMLNFKANHRKVVLTDKELLVMSANPHDASSAHWNVGLRIKGAALSQAWTAESAILKLSSEEDLMPPSFKASPVMSPKQLQLLTERRIKEHALTLLNQAKVGQRIDLTMFYFSDKDLRDAFISARERGCKIRVILDAGHDSFGREKNGIPNRQTAETFVQSGIPVRWANTHGEQCHAKMLYVEQQNGYATLLLGSGNYTRRNMDNYNAECDLAFTAPLNDPAMKKARRTFDDWWSNVNGREYVVPYHNFADPSRWRRFLSWWMESTGMGTF